MTETASCYWTCLKKGEGHVSWGPLRFDNSESVKGVDVSWGPLRFGPNEAVSSTAVCFILFGMIGYAIYWYRSRSSKSAGKSSSNSDDNKLPSPLKVTSSSRGTPVAAPSSSAEGMYTYLMSMR